MSQNYKNALQEFFQSKGLSLPQYTSERVGGEPHDPIWRSSVVVSNGDVFEGDKKSSKKLAEQSVAQIALESVVGTDFCSSHISKKSIWVQEYHEEEYSFDFKSKNKKVAVLIDIENVPSALSEFIGRVFTTNLKIYVFISKGHPIIEKIEGTKSYEDPRVKMIVVPSTRSDGADVGMTMMAATLIERKSYDTYFVITKDHFGEALADCIRNYGKMALYPEKKKAYCEANVKYTIEKMEEYLEKL